MPTLREKQLYHQIHPVKLAADWASTPFSLYFLWHHSLAVGILLSLIPAAIASAVVILWIPLDRYVQNPAGNYLKKYMTPVVQVARMIGFVAMAVGAWFHVVIAIVAGLALILFCWTRGVLLPGKTAH